jgi:glycosyltransferase involved in cell wall biosynthesis
MKLLFISGDTALAQGKKGPFYYLLEEFSKYWERIDIICPKTTQRIFNVFGNVFIHSSNKSIIFHPWFILKKGAELYREQKFDIFGVHSYPPFYNDIGGRWLFNKIKTPYVLEVMHIVGHPKSGDFKEWFYKILNIIFLRFSARKAKAIRVINQKQVPGFLKKFGIKEIKIKYAPAFYIDFNTFKPADSGKKYDLVFSGRLVKNKGIHLLLEAIKKLKAQNSSLKTVIIGDGPLKLKIQKFVEENKLEENIELSGWLPSIEDLAKFYNQAKILVMPSFNEGGPRVTLEAMACKVPVITSRVGIMLDIINENENGLFIDWNVNDIADKISLLLKNDQLYKKIVENGYQTVQQFERKKSIKNYAETYQNLLHSTGI